MEIKFITKEDAEKLIQEYETTDSPLRKEQILETLDRCYTYVRTPEDDEEEKKIFEEYMKNVAKEQVNSGSSNNDDLKSLSQLSAERNRKLCKKTDGSRGWLIATRIAEYAIGIICVYLLLSAIQIATEVLPEFQKPAFIETIKEALWEGNIFRILLGK